LGEFSNDIGARITGSPASKWTIDVGVVALIGKEKESG
jgi:hypothetical protein